MADIFVDSASVGALSPYSTWATAATTLAAAIPPAVAGDTIYVANTHSESTAADVFYTLPGTAASPNRILCVTPSGAAGGRRWGANIRLQHRHRLGDGTHGL